jgi:hypothetical protein
MATSGFGVQNIRPRSGAGWKGTNPSPERIDETKRHPREKQKPHRKAPEPGTGRIVDKIA